MLSGRRIAIDRGRRRAAAAAPRDGRVAPSSSRAATRDGGRRVVDLLFDGAPFTELQDARGSQTPQHATAPAAPSRRRWRPASRSAMSLADGGRARAGIRRRRHRHARVAIGHGARAARSLLAERSVGASRRADAQRPTPRVSRVPYSTPDILELCRFSPIGPARRSTLERARAAARRRPGPASRRRRRHVPRAGPQSQRRPARAAISSTRRTSRWRSRPSSDRATKSQARWPGARLALHHRIGRLEIGEASVAIAAASPHRGDAFAACRYAIERVKQIAPIWKREFFEGGDVWIEGATADPDDETARAEAERVACA